MTLEVEVPKDAVTDLVEAAVDNKVREVPYWVAVFLAEKALSGFESGINPWGIPWAPLAQSTIEARKRRGNSSIRPLIDTGRMLMSLRVEREGDSAVIHMDAPAGYHQSGTRRMPAREIFPMEGDAVAIPDSWARDLADFVADHL